MRWATHPIHYVAPAGLLRRFSQYPGLRPGLSYLRPCGAEIHGVNGPTPSLARRVSGENDPANSFRCIELQNCSKSLSEVLTVTTLFVNNWT